MFKGIKIYLPAIEDMPFFYEFADMCRDYGYNTLVMELGGAMEYKSHPEINEAWVRYCKLFRDYQGQSLDVQHSAKWAKNSIHCENGGGSWIPQEEIKKMIAYCKERDIEIIPEVPCLSHSDYLLQAHPEFAENTEDVLPDAYCPQNPGIYQLLFELLDEIIALFGPKTIHIGHDELYTIGLCEKCRGKDPVELFSEDIKKIYRYLKDRGIQTMLWSDKLLNAHSKRGKDWGGAYRTIYSEKTGEFLHHVPELYPAIDKIPKDVKIMHWYWSVRMELEEEFLTRGFWTVYGNFAPGGFPEWGRRFQQGIQGFCISNWSRMNRAHMQRNGIFFHMAYANQMLAADFDETKFQESFMKATDNLYAYMNRKTLMREHIEITHTTSAFHEHHPFVDGFEIDYSKDLLGSYEIRYKDGSVETVPVTYGLNIGNKNRNFERTMDAEFDLLKCAPHLLEAAGSCKYEWIDGEMWYTFCIPMKKPAEKVAFYPKGENGDEVEIKQIQFITAKE